MQNFFRAFSVALLSGLAALCIPGSGLGAAPIKSHHTTAARVTRSTFEEEANALYCRMDLESYGLDRAVFECAYKGYRVLLNQHLVANNQVMTICDFSQSSRNKRLYVLNMEEQRILVNTYVAHGRRSGGEFARSFSNHGSSHKSSLGFYVTERTYTGKHGYALRLQGLEKGFNDRASRRNIVIHASKYVGPDFLTHNRYNGRSFGCPAIPTADLNEVIEDMKGGTCFFIYHPTAKYLKGSKILNG